MANQPDALTVLMEGFEELVESLKQVAGQEVELQSQPKDPDDVGVLVLQNRVAYQLGAIHRFLGRHVEDVDMLPLTVVMEAYRDLIRVKGNHPVLQAVATLSRPTATSAAFPEHWHTLVGLVCAALQSHMDAGLTRGAAAVRIARALVRHGIGDPQGNQLGDTTIARWFEGDDLKDVRNKYIAEVRAHHPKWKVLDKLADDLLIRWRKAAEARGYRFR
jgi:hypothetical protein